MSKSGIACRWGIVEGVPVTWRGITVTPQSRRLVVRLPFAVFAWERPAGIMVEQDEWTTHMRIQDITRILQIGLPVLGVAVQLAVMAISTNRRFRNESNA
jgi:hypothetical protein